MRRNIVNGNNRETINGRIKYQKELNGDEQKEAGNKGNRRISLSVGHTLLSKKKRWQYYMDISTFIGTELSLLDNLQVGDRMLKRYHY